MTPRQHRPPLHRLWAGWLAALLVLFATLAPTVSHALALGNAMPGMEICTSSGPQTLPADSPAGPEAVKHLVHCPFCLQSTDQAVLPASAVAYLFLLPGELSQALALQVFFYEKRASLTPPPRGPPASV
ncbi:DUF2946 domain-containing protein [Rhodoferax saidenbachensis]|uniref:DUF2946 domain-containing protein n=1 Tax=Rhodoferax saidenbachensis TaxID=1484693 RepID=A0A1P8K616_9BURK|nr:DUF2946 domain-containing protein [Rhodoferax saidenbachensis]APW41463.1 hypothetical protein RS694_02090 [Rhodoferax saidenbachensis]